MATSFVDICNQGLIDIGATPILDFPPVEDTKASRLCGLVYKSVRDYVLRSHPWNCAMRRVTLSPSVTAPAFGYDNAFVLPAECLRIWSLDGITDFRKEGQGIVCNETALNVLYVARIEDATLLDEMLATVISKAIAAKLCFALSESQPLAKDKYAEFKEMLRKAKFVDSSEDPSPAFEADTWLQSRLGQSTGSL